MDSSDIAILILSGVLSFLPGLILWTAVLVFAVRRLKRDAGRAERFLMAGAVLMIISTLSYAPIFLMPILTRASRGRELFIALPYFTSLAKDIINLAGAICFIRAFWLKFNARNSARAEQNHI